MFLLMNKDAIVIPNESSRQNKKEYLGVRYSVKKAESTEPLIPPMESRVQA